MPIKRLLISIFFLMTICYSQEFVREYTYEASELDSKISSREAALMQVKTLLIEELGVYVKRTIEHELSEYANHIEDNIRIKDLMMTEYISKTEILSEKWDGKTYYIKAKISVDETSISETFREVTEDKNIQDKDDIFEKISGGEVNWKKKIIRVKGFGAANKAFPKLVWKQSAEKAAISDAQRRIIELVNGLQLHAKTYTKNFQIDKDIILIEVKGKIKNYKYNTVHPTDDTAEVILEVDISDITQID